MMAAEVSGSSGSSSSDASNSTAEEERVRRLFQTCDGDGDGYINRSENTLNSLVLQEKLIKSREAEQRDARGDVTRVSVRLLQQCNDLTREKQTHNRV